MGARVPLMVAVAYDPGAGPRCTIETPDGAIHHAYRVPPDYPETESHGVFWGRPCVAWWRDAKSHRPLTNEFGQQVTGPKPGGGVELATSDDPELVVVYLFIAPPLRPRLEFPTRRSEPLTFEELREVCQRPRPLHRPGAPEATRRAPRGRR